MPHRELCDMLLQPTDGESERRFVDVVTAECHPKWGA